MDIIDSIPTSKTLEINAIAKKLKSQGKDIINLTTGEPDFPTPEPIKEKAKEALKNNFTKYTDSKGIYELREAISTMLKGKGIYFSNDEIVVTNGGKQAIFNSIMSILDKGDEIILFSPLWVSYIPMVMLVGAEPVIVETKFENDFLPTKEDIISKLTDKTKVILINSPNNPTGSVYSKEILEEIAEIANKNNIFVIADEVYDSLVYDGSFTSLYGMVNEDLLIYVNAFSKAYSMTGWRIGFVATKNEVVYRRIAKLQSHTTSSTNSISQYAAIEATVTDNSKMVEEFRKRRNFAVEKAKEIGLDFVNPKGAFYLFFKSPVEDDEAFCKELLEKKLVALVPGSAFNANGFVRLSFANSIEILSEGFKRIGEFLKENINP
ncbi:pyridoxal phosphate-dependent aminotransferase [Thermosipho ferrireducens]|uniref:Pyridoxal phosphate-dependent aminotransferase n=1 Tax=Thermosipho ferrireducens TaxID=2571116 RepID=A0ABX7S891_9BACT|nr:aspartate aminotransferase [Thermosipho ferrireducens]QTA38812.1 pyridoxal phosphate-dependent aminotransferase [Thermosipho ferrireducens]